MQTSVADILSWKAEPTDAVIHYGAAPAQVAELRLPPTPGPYPVAVVIHGGCWQAEFDRTHATPMSVALAKSGFAVWTIEYRKLGEKGGGWPGTFQDVGDAIDALKAQAGKYSLDLSRVVLVGHSAGGQLALWYSASEKLPASSPIHRHSALPIRGVVVLAGMTDLGAPNTACGDSGVELIGGKDLLGKRAAEASPIAMLPIGVRQRLVHGVEDRVVPIALGRAYAKAARAAGDDIQLTELPGIGHFDLINPKTGAWPTVIAAVRELSEPVR
ncbi:MAG: Lipase/esterase [Verrucomicrobia bacterium]|nr:Lipase/esterase [Verrucomicrobiota bacterium]